MRTYSPIVTALLLIAVALNVYQCDRAKKEKESRLADLSSVQQTITEKEATIGLANAMIEGVRFKLRTDSLNFASVKSALTSKIALYKKKVKELGEVTPQEQADTVCARLIAKTVAQDSVIRGHEVLEVAQETYFSAKITDLETIITQKDTLIASQVAITNALETELANSQSETRKERRRKNWVARGFGVAVIGIVALIAMK